MELITIGEHTIDKSLLSGCIAIDVGCLGFTFSTEIQKLGCRVLAYDIQDLQPPEGIEFHRKAIWNNDCILRYNQAEDKQATHISDLGSEYVPAITLNHIYKKHKNVDVLKIDAEGSEYFILSDPFWAPEAKQISIEFHAHCFPDLHEKYYNRCINQLLTHYEEVQHEWTSEHCAGYNYWNSLFIRKDLC